MLKGFIESMDKSACTQPDMSLETYVKNLDIDSTGQSISHAGYGQV